MARPRKSTKTVACERKFDENGQLIISDKHTPTIHSRSRVIEFTCAGFTQGQIARYLDLSEPTLRKYYANELDNSMAMRTGKLARNLYLDALKGDRVSREFWLKTRARWTFAKPPEEAEKTDKVISLLEELNQNTKK